jgi:transcriptional regulator with XRE-family HTH domain
MSRRPRSDQSKALDARIGARLREGRRLRGLSQAVVAAQVGLSFQQLQKYERGANRIGAGQLLLFSQVLALPVGFFYEGLGADQPVTEDAVQSAAANRLLRDWPALPEAVQTAALGLVRVLAELHRPDDGAAVMADTDPQAAAPVVLEAETVLEDAAAPHERRRRRYGAVWDPADVRRPPSGNRTS